MEDSNEIHDNGGSSPLSSPVDEGHEPILASPTASSPINTTAAISSQSPTNPGTITMAKRKAKPKKKVVVHRAPKKSKWNAENILTDPKSPLATADLRNILSNPAAWDVLDAADRQEILSLFPDGQHVLEPGTEHARPDFLSLKNDDTFRYDCAAYTENLAEGRFDQEWLQCAWSAHERRKMGDFDEHLLAGFEEDWQVSLPEDFKPKRQPAPTHTVDEISQETEPSAGDQAPEQSPTKRVEMTFPEVEEETGASNGPKGAAGKAAKEATEKAAQETAEAAAEAVAEKARPAQEVDQATDKPPRDSGNSNSNSKYIDELQESAGAKKKRVGLPVTRKRRRTTKGHVNETDSEDELA